MEQLQEHLEALRKPLWAEYNRLKKELTETEQMLRATGVTSFPVASSSTSPSQPAPNRPLLSSSLGQPNQPIEMKVRSFSLTQLIRDACVSIGTSITLEKVIDYISETHPELQVNPHSVSAILSSGLVKSNFITRVEIPHGKSGRGNVYELTNHANIVGANMSNRPDGSTREDLL